MTWITQYINVLWVLILEMSPWLLLGFFFAGVLKAFVPNNLIVKNLGKSNFSSVLNATLIGVPLPLCSCGVIPTAVSLYKNGASKGATNSFLISTPQTGVDSILASYAMLGLPIAIFRVAIAFMTGLYGGVLTNLFFPKNSDEKIDFQSSEKPLTLKEKIKKTFYYGYVEMVQDLYKWLIIGFLLAALISVTLPSDFFGQYIGNFYLELLIVLLLSIPLYVCATGSIPIALALISKGLSPEAVILFLMAGPATNIATIVVIKNVMGLKSILIYLFSIISGGIIFALLMHYTIDNQWLTSTIPNIGEHHHSVFQFINIISGIILIILIIHVIILPFYKKIPIMTDKPKIIKVDGMTCNHCSANVENNVGKISGVDKVKVDLSTKNVYIEGNPDIEQIKHKITELGYTVIE